MAPWANAPLKQESRIEDLAAGPAVLQLVQHPGRLDPGRPEPVLAGVGGGEVQPPPGVQQPVAGQVDQQQVPGAPAVQEVLDRQPDPLGWLVDHGGDGKAADARVGQDLSQVGGVPGRGTQLAQSRIGGVGGGRHHQGQPGPGQRVSRRGHGGPARHR